MVVEDYMNVPFRGWVLIVKGKELETMDIPCGKKIIRGDTTFTIKGVERTKYDDNWWAIRAGLILSPNNKVPDYFEIGQEVELID